ncbi:Sec23 trunk domain-containing protein [Aphis craccivora]|uniref:Sec23 trunk domain-containing protein n=1 Tax=Aphis craccivora TaxID=307492 RepID=A0A6G0ZA65_APHCR|nr:Sec23 trunk domain-containing protein [Aphis craccivora]
MYLLMQLSINSSKKDKSLSLRYYLYTEKNFLNYNHKKKSIWSKTGFAYKFPFFCYFFRVFPDDFENYWKFFTFDPPKYQLDSLSYQKQIPLFEIEAFLLLQNVVTDTKIKK